MLKYKYRSVKVWSTYLMILIGSLWIMPLEGHEWMSSRADGHAPIGVMGDHIHKKGEWMASFRTMTMQMKGNRKGSANLSSSEVHSLGYRVAPTEMTMQMQMLGLMYAPSDRLTLMLMAPWIQNSMDHLMKNGQSFTTDSDGIGDLKLSALLGIYHKGNRRFHANIGLSFPSGDIERRDDTPMKQNTLLPYPMQLGSGTFDLSPGLTYAAQAQTHSWGWQLQSTFRLGRNDRDYSLGNRLDLNMWMSRLISSSFSLSSRFHFQSWGNISGEDADLNPMMVPTADSALRGGRRLDVLLGCNISPQKGALKGHRLALEFGVPVLQNLEGPQLEMDFNALVGWQYAW